MSLRGIKLVTFDVTNTLLQFKVPAWQYYAIVAQDYGFKGNEEQVKAKFIKSFQIMREKHPNFGRKSIEWEEWWTQVVSMTLKDYLPRETNVNTVARQLIEEFKTQKCWQCASGGEKLLQHFKKLGIRVGVISNFDPRLNDILSNVCLKKHLDFVVTSYEIGYSKPDKRIFKSAIEKCKVPITPSEALHIGDDIVKDYQGARAAGWHALLVNPDLEDEAPEPQQEHVFKSLEELSTAVGEMNLKL
ncbi:unnamed protein product [Spodoptera littoralis]|uniref:Rhythmically expressed gene 2 protein n=1 Tax=Spodoptera littoralis TaxID=7109 RepID=A0A9P0III8_SPOLI|nr:unnamed protein product [Spodoptera littoralis]CAH1647331.1 unnamed protein product [Spodoptera littoralis]